jgi:hypothetical protein
MSKSKADKLRDEVIKRMARMSPKPQKEFQKELQQRERRPRGRPPTKTPS